MRHNGVGRLSSPIAEGRGESTPHAPILSYAELGVGADCNATRIGDLMDRKGERTPPAERVCWCCADGPSRPLMFKFGKSLTKQFKNLMIVQNTVKHILENVCMFEIL